MENARQKTQRKAWVERKLAEDPDYFKKLGKKGGSVKSDLKGFGSMALFNPLKHHAASVKGGTTTSRKKAVDKV